MQQRLAVASVLVLVMLAGTSALLIQHNAFGQNQPKSASQATTQESSSTTTTTTNSTSVSTGGSLLTTGNHNMTGSGDDHETSTETLAHTSTNATLDD